MFCQLDDFSVGDKSTNTEQSFHGAKG